MYMTFKRFLDIHDKKGNLRALTGRRSEKENILVLTSRDLSLIHRLQSSKGTKI